MSPHFLYKQNNDKQKNVTAFSVFPLQRTDLFLPNYVASYVVF